MAMSQALGIAELIARSDLETNSAITAMRNGINATKPLAERRDSSEMGKLAPSPTINAIASHDPRKAAIINGMVDLVLCDSDAREMTSKKEILLTLASASVLGG